MKKANVKHAQDRAKQKKQMDVESFNETKNEDLEKTIVANEQRFKSGHFQEKISEIY